MSTSCSAPRGATLSATRPLSRSRHAWRSASGRDHAQARAAPPANSVRRRGAPRPSALRPRALAAVGERGASARAAPRRRRRPRCVLDAAARPARFSRADASRTNPSVVRRPCLLGRRRRVRSAVGVRGPRSTSSRVEGLARSAGRPFCCTPRRCCTRGRARGALRSDAPATWLATARPLTRARVPSTAWLSIASSHSRGAESRTPRHAAASRRRLS